MQEGRGALSRAMKDLTIRWGEVRATWHDAVAKDFEEKFLAQLERELRTATATMDAMAQVLHQAKSDCR